jgi:hypothetical protein
VGFTRALIKQVVRKKAGVAAGRWAAAKDANIGGIVGVVARANKARREAFVSRQQVRHRKLNRMTTSPEDDPSGRDCLSLKF